MGAATLVSVEEYLRTSYSPDREYVDGRIVERNLGEKTHSSIQGNLLGWFQVTPMRFRIPDVTVVKNSQPQGEIFTNPPHLCIEILSKDDTMEEVQEKIDDYLRFGIPYVWIVNPRLRKGFVATKAGLVEAESGILTTSDPGIRVPVAGLFDIA